MPGLPKKDTFGLGYIPTPEDLKRALANINEQRKARREGRALHIKPYPLTLNGQFIREGEDEPCYEFPEPFVQSGMRHPGFEIFLDCNLLDEIFPQVVREPTPSCFDLKALGLLFG